MSNMQHIGELHILNDDVHTCDADAQLYGVITSSKSDSLGNVVRVLL